MKIVSNYDLTYRVQCLLEADDGNSGAVDGKLREVKREEEERKKPLP
jgi:hypothetical protein